MKASAPILPERVKMKLPKSANETVKIERANLPKPLANKSYALYNDLVRRFWEERGFGRVGGVRSHTDYPGNTLRPADIFMPRGRGTFCVILYICSVFCASFHSLYTRYIKCAASLFLYTDGDANTDGESPALCSHRKKWGALSAPDPCP